MKIYPKKYFSKVNSLSIREIPTLELLYVCDDEFKEEILNIRKQFDLTTNKEGLVPDHEFINFENSLLFDSRLKSEFEGKILNLANKFKIKNLKDDLYGIVELGMTEIPVNDEGYVVIGTKIGRPFINLDTEYFTGWPTLKLHIKQPINQKDLHEWIDKYKTTIIKSVNKYFEDSAPQITRLDKIERIIKIVELRDQGFKYSQIADKLCKIFENHPDVVQGNLNDVSIRKIYNRYKNKFLRD